MTTACTEVLFTMAVLELLSSEYPMALTRCEEQSEAVASSVKGDPTVALFKGLLTLTPFEVAEEVVGAGAGVGAGVGAGDVADAVVTSTVTSATHDAPLFPQAFTCTVCVPVAEVTWASMEVDLTMVVLLLLSREKPIAETG